MITKTHIVDNKLVLQYHTMGMMIRQIFPVSSSSSFWTDKQTARNDSAMILKALRKIQQYDK